MSNTQVSQTVENRIENLLRQKLPDSGWHEAWFFLHLIEPGAGMTASLEYRMKADLCRTRLRFDDDSGIVELFARLRSEAVSIGQQKWTLAQAHLTSDGRCDFSFRVPLPPHDPGRTYSLEEIQDRIAECLRFDYQFDEWNKAWFEVRREDDVFGLMVDANTPTLYKGKACSSIGIDSNGVEGWFELLDAELAKAGKRGWSKLKFILYPDGRHEWEYEYPEKSATTESTTTKPQVTEIEPEENIWIEDDEPAEAKPTSSTASREFFARSIARGPTQSAAADGRSPQELINEIGQWLADSVPWFLDYEVKHGGIKRADWTLCRVDGEVRNGMLGLTVVAETPSDGRVELPAEEELDELFESLREAMDDDGQGHWSGAHYTLTPQGQVEVDFDYPDTSTEASRREAEFAEFLETCHRELCDKLAAHHAAWHINDATNVRVDQQAGTLAFVFPDGHLATCPMQIVGTFNSADNTWLWGWDHPSVREPIQHHARLVKAYGEQHQLSRLTTSKLHCPAAAAWQFTALACKLAQSQGAYATTSGSTVVFMTFGSVELSQS
jgi:hypothetical protein